MTCEIWQDLQCLSAMARQRRDRLVDQPDQGLGVLHWDAGGIMADFSGLGITAAARSLLVDLARDSGVFDRRTALFEGRRDKQDLAAGLPKTMLRRPWGHSAMVDGTELSLAVAGARHWPECLSQAVREGALHGATGRPFSAVLHLGPKAPAEAARAVVAALADPANSGPEVHFMALQDAPMDSLLDTLDPAETLVILGFEELSSQTALALTEPVMAWLDDALGPEAAATHLVAVTNSAREALDLGIPAERVIAAGAEWLAGYSVWSPLHLGLNIALGNDRLADLRTGGWEADLHFRDSEDAENLALHLGIADVWLEQTFGTMRRAPVVPASWPGIEAAQIAGRAADPNPRGLPLLDRDREAWQDLALLHHATIVQGGGSDSPNRIAGKTAPGIDIVCQAHTARVLGRLIALNEHRQHVFDTIRTAQERPATLQTAAPVSGSNVISLAERRASVHP